MVELIILLGMGESGKTTYANSLTTHKTVSFDGYNPYGSEGSFNTALCNIAKDINKSPDTNFVLDGYAYLVGNEIVGKQFDLLEDLLLFHTIKPVVVLSDIDGIVKRVLKRGSPDKVDRSFVVSLYNSIFNNFKVEDIIVNDIK